MLTAGNCFYSYSHNKAMQTLECFQLSGMQITSEDISNNYDDCHKSIKGIAISYILKKVNTAAIKAHPWLNKPKTELCHTLEIEKILISSSNIILPSVYLLL